MRSGAAPAAPTSCPLTILLAEDNVVNQRVAIGISGKTRAHGGQRRQRNQAVRAVATQRFDLVLMDVQMPEMDGLEATTAIRLAEEGTGRHTPIVAMTAHVLSGDRERCLAAGMDDYLSKPIKPDQLHAMIAKMVSATPAKARCDEETDDEAADASLQQAPRTPVANEAVDLPSLLARVENDWDLLDELIALFLESSPLLVAEIEAGLMRGDSPTIERAAHALKGAMQNIGATSAARAAAKMEETGRMDDLESATRALAELKQEFDVLVSVLSDPALRGRT